MKPAILSVDLGSGAVKAAVVDDAGALLATGAAAIDLMLGDGGAAEQDPEQLWQAVKQACGQAIQGSNADIVGLSCSSQYSSVIAVDKAGDAVANLLLWRDTRGARHAKALLDNAPGSRDIWTEIHGLPPSPEGRDTLAHMLYIKQELREIYDRTHAFLEPVDYLNLRFTGVIAANQASVYKMLLTDNRRTNGTTYDPTLLALAGIDEDKLAPLVEMDAVIGEVRADVARELGLPGGVMVLTGVNDNHAVALGTGALDAGRAGISIGTTANISALVDGLRTDLPRRLAAMPSPYAGSHMVMAENGLGGKVLELMLKQMLLPDEADPFAILEQAVRRSPPGSGGLLFLPWINGAGSPAQNARARAGFLNISVDTTRDHMLSAVLEGIAFNLHWLNQAVEEFVGGRFERMMFAGGGAQSTAWSQILADILDRPIHRMADPRHTPCKGLAYRALVSLGHLGDNAEERFLRVAEVYDPRPEHRDLYDTLYARFLAAYERINER
ncbi:MAG: FGGY-family carbohydrate kinase [Alphaproteobacteria bacterium]